jgi:hypothetical protein
LPDLIRIRTSCFPEDRASETAWRTSDGLLTGLPPGPGQAPAVKDSQAGPWYFFALVGTAR